MIALLLWTVILAADLVFLALGRELAAIAAMLVSIAMILGILIGVVLRALTALAAWILAGVLSVAAFVLRAVATPLQALISRRADPAAGAA